MEYSKRTSVISIIVGHVTKGGDIAGPKLLEHMVDVVLNFEGDKSHFFRILRGAKNRFGATDEIGIFEMKPEGLSPVLNPSSYFVEECQEVSGSCRSVIMEGSQPFLVEVQALVTDNYFAYPKRTAIGYDPNRLSLLLAVMEKRMGIQFGQLDVCVNLAGGVRSTDPALDLAVIAAIYSSLKNTCISSRALFLGEVGLGGEIRMISRLESRLKEASRQGALHSVCPEIKRAGFKWKKTEMKLCALEHIGKLRDWLSELEKES
jgi:DNA repair protein RadA/Sms